MWRELAIEGRRYSAILGSQSTSIASKVAIVTTRKYRTYRKHTVASITQRLMIACFMLKKLAKLANLSVYAWRVRGDAETLKKALTVASRKARRNGGIAGWYATVGMNTDESWQLASAEHWHVMATMPAPKSANAWCKALATDDDVAKWSRYMGKNARLYLDHAKRAGTPLKNALRGSKAVIVRLLMWRRLDKQAKKRWHVVWSTRNATFSAVLGDATVQVDRLLIVDLTERLKMRVKMNGKRLVKCPITAVWTTYERTFARRCHDRSKHANRRARQVDAIGTLTNKDVIAVYGAARGVCQMCGCELGQNWHIDHIIPLMNGGVNERANIQAVCKRCNEVKHTYNLHTAKARLAARGIKPIEYDGVIQRTFLTATDG